MNRRQLTERNSRFNVELIETYKEAPVDDYLLRSAEEQNRLFKKKLSKKDGYIKLSAHQKGTAIDKYLTRVNPNGSVTILFTWPKDKAIKYHKIWEEKYGGKPMISWDMGHFE